jgi:arylsulfatase
MPARIQFTNASVFAAAVTLGWLTASYSTTGVVAQQKDAGTSRAAGTPDVLPRPDFHFSGNVGRTILDSDKPQFPQPVQPPKGAPNVVLILLDDTGFGQYETFGGGIPSPTRSLPAATTIRLRSARSARPPRATTATPA